MVGGIADPMRRLGKKAGAIRIHGSGFRRLLLRFVHLKHGAIENNGRPEISYDAVDRRTVGDVEIRMFQRRNVVILCQTACEMAANESGGAGDQQFHLGRA